MEITDKSFYDQAMQRVIETIKPKHGEGFTVAHTSECRVCTRPLYGEAHEEWHVSKHAAQLGLHYY